jgi:PPK2 family polyphosphate:nucleotide phosphotransferase
VTSKPTVDYRKRFRVEPGTTLQLGRIDPDFKGAHETHQQAQPDLDLYGAKLTRQQTLMYAERKHALLIVLQALDSGGKDGTVNHVFGAFNAQGATVTGFKQPTPLELAHDFLWRVHPHVPARGWVAIFNRSHYEDVLVTRVHKLIDRATWIQRYERIRDFEAELFESGTTIAKFFLHISKQEQLERFEKRLDDPAHRWKISEADYSERELWDDYMRAYEDALSATSTPHAPWYVIPANHKWFRNLAVSQIVADTLEDLGMTFPQPTVDLADIRRRYHAAVLQEQQQQPSPSRRK